jgi:hypothetical protein
MDPPFFQFRNTDTVYDGLYADDPGASLGVLLSCGHYLFDAEMWRLMLRGKRRKGAPAQEPHTLAPTAIQPAQEPVERRETVVETLTVLEPARMHVDDWALTEALIDRREPCSVEV